MINNTNKEQWIDEVLRSTEGMQRVQHPGDLLEQINLKLSKSRAVKATPFPLKQWVAAAVLLILLNAGSVVYFAVNSRNEKNIVNANPLAAEMQTGSTYNY
jgi:hypothetical protein